MLTNSQLLLLDNLIYLERVIRQETNDRSVEQIIYDLLHDGGLDASIDPNKIGTIDEYPARMTRAEWVEVLEMIEADPELCSYTLTKGVDNQSTGLRAACFVKGTDINVVFRGTYGDAEWHDNGQGGYLADTQFQQDALDYFNNSTRAYEDFYTFTVTGHSKGGNKAQYVTILSEKVDRCVSFDGQGFSKEFLDKYSEQIAANANKIASVCAENDFVNCLLFPIATQIMYLDTEEQEDFLQNHCPNILLDGSGQLRPIAEQGLASMLINDFTKYICDYNLFLPGQKAKIFDSIIGWLESSDSSVGMAEKVLSLFRVPDLLAISIAYGIHLTLAGDLQLLSMFMGGAEDAVLDHIVGTGLDDLLTGNDDNNIIDGYGGDDRLNGNGGNDIISGGTGNDTISGGDGNDFLYGDEGNDIIYGNSGDDIIEGYTGNDNLSGDSGSDSISGGDGDDVLQGGDGNDFIFGGAGNDIASGGSGNDYMEAGDGGDQLYGEDGNDRLIGGNGNQLLEGGNGNDTIEGGGSGLKSINGGYGNDILYSGEETNIINGNADDDTIWFGKSQNETGTIDGGTGNDTYIYYGRSDNIHYAITDQDSMEGNTDRLRLNAARPLDVIFQDSGNDLLLTFSNNDNSIAIKDYFDPANPGHASYEHKIEEIVLTDEITVNNVVIGNDVDNIIVADSGNDVILGKGGNDEISSGAGIDILFGGDGYDLLKGGTGNDILHGDGNSDQLYGEDGNDHLNGGTGNDELYGGDGDDLLYGEDGNDMLYSGNGDDELYGGNGNDVLDVRQTEGFKRLFGDDGDDVLYGGDGDDILSSGNGKDELYGGNGDDFLIAYDTSGNKILNGENGNDSIVAQGTFGFLTLIGGNGNDSLLGGYGAATFDAGDGNDYLEGTHSTYDNLFLCGDGDDHVNAGIGSDTIYGGDGDDSLIGDPSDTLGNGNDVIYGGLGNDDIHSYGGNDELYGDEGNDLIFGGTGDQILDGGDGADKLFAGEGNQNLSGGAGDDELYGASTESPYVNWNQMFYGGDGDDRIDTQSGTATVYGEAGNDFLSGNFDTVIFGGIGDDFMTGGEELYGDDGDDTIHAGDATLAAFGGTGNDIMTGTRLYGEDGDDDIAGSLESYGGDGDDILRGGSTAMMYGDAGNDTIYGGAALFGGEGNDEMYGGTDSILYGGDGNDSMYGGNNLFGGDGDDIMVAGSTSVLYGGAGNDMMRGGNIVCGGDGDDRLIGGDILDGEAGNDYLEGGENSTTYIFNIGHGQDTILDYSSVAEAVDTIEFENRIKPGDLKIHRTDNDMVITFTEGTDCLIIQNYYDESSYDVSHAIEQFHFYDGTSWDSNTIHSQTVYMNGNESPETLYGTPGNDIIHAGAGDDNVYGGEGQNIVYGEDGTDSLYGGREHDELYGGAGADYLDGNFGEDYLDGGAGNDTYYFALGYGTDTVSDNDNTAGNIDTIKFEEGITPSSITIHRVGQNMEIRVDGCTDKLIIQSFYTNDSYKLERFEFNDGTIWDASTIYSQSVYRTGTEAAETITGTDQNEIIDGRGGNDTLKGNLGNDTYIFGIGYGFDTINDYDTTVSNIDTIRFAEGITPGDIRINKVNYHMDITIVGHPDKLRIQSYYLNSYYKIERFEFSDGTVWNLDTINEQTVYITGTEASETITGSAGKDVLDGLGGNDTLVGTAGNDTYIFGIGYGVDTINDFDSSAGNIDTIQFLEGISPTDIRISRVGSDMVISFINPEDKLIIKSYYASESYKIEQIRYNDGTVWDAAAINSRTVYVTGTEASETLLGTSGSDIIAGLGGDDVLKGSFGNDVYLFNLGDGIDTVDDYDDTGANTDTILFGTGITASDIQIFRNGYNMEINIQGSSDRLILRNHYAHVNSRIEAFEFADGTKWDYTAITDQLVHLNGTEGADRINGTSAKEVLHGNAGDDLLYGNGNDDILYGGAGNDNLYGGAGNDVLDGGTEDDYLEGGAGGDTYLFGMGYGVDTIYDSNSTIDAVDKIDYGDDALNLIFSKTGDDLTVLNANANDVLTIQSWYTGSSRQIEQIYDCSGSIILNTQIDQLIQEMAVFEQQNSMSWSQAIEQRPEDVQNILSQFWVAQ